MEFLLIKIEDVTLVESFLVDVTSIVCRILRIAHFQLTELRLADGSAGGQQKGEKR